MVVRMGHNATYLLLALDHLLQEVHVGRVYGRQVGLAVLQQEVVELPLALHLGAELVDVDGLHTFSRLHIVR